MNDPKHVFGPRLIAIATIVLGAASVSVPAADSAALYLLGGQSNMVGTDVAFPPWDEPQLDVGHYYDVGQHETKTFIPLQPRPNTQFGPELSFGHDMVDAAPEGEDVYLLEHATGGTDLCVEWLSPGGVEYLEFLTTYDEGTSLLAEIATRPRVAGMVWMQGENDAWGGGEPECGLAYEVNLTNFIADVRALVGEPQMPFVIGKIKAIGNPFEDLVRDAQERVAATDRDVGIFSTDDLTLRDLVHFDAESLVELGHRFALEMLRLQSLQPADIDGDGFVDFVDFLSLLSVWGPCEGCLHDLDHDGVVGLIDLLTMLASWDAP